MSGLHLRSTSLYLALIDLTHRDESQSIFANLVKYAAEIDTNSADFLVRLSPFRG